MRRFLAGVAIMLLLAVPRAEAQEGLGSPIFKHEVTKEVLISRVKSGCPSDLFNVTCKEFLATLQAADAEVAPKFTKDLFLYLESLEEGLCGTEEARLATFYAFPRRVVMYNEVRRFSPTEKCLKRGGKNILSLWCGNANVTNLKVTSSTPLPKDIVYKETFVTVHDTAFVPQRASAPSDALPKPAPVKVAGKSHKTRNIVVGAVVAVAGIACAILCRADVEQTVNVNGQPQNPGGDKGGAPVNPRNNRSLMTAGTGIRISLW